MKVSGRPPERAASTQVWAALNDPAVLVRTIPGCQQLGEVGPDALQDDDHGRGRLDQGHLRRRRAADRPGAARTVHAQGRPAPARPARSARRRGHARRLAGDGTTADATTPTPSSAG